MTFDEALAIVRDAKSAGDIPHSVRRQLFKELHPDVAPSDRMPEAEAAIRELNALLAPPASEIQVSSRRGSYRISVPATKSDDLINVYACAWSSRTGELKVARSTGSGHLLRNEARVLKTLGDGTDDPFRVYVPELVDSFRWRVPGKGDRVTNVVTHVTPPSARCTLAYVEQCFPAGLDPRDVAWMWRRSLAAMSWWHDHEVAHTALSRDNIWLVPTDHGMIVTDWYRAPEKATRDARIKDIVRAGELMLSLTRTPPRQFRAFLRGCETCDDAAEALANFTDLIERLYGARKFRPISIPGID